VDLSNIFTYKYSYNLFTEYYNKTVGKLEMFMDFCKYYFYVIWGF